MEANIIDLNLDDEEEAPIPCEEDLHKEDEDHQILSSRKSTHRYVIHFSSLKEH
ncbi:hypothetical protein Gotri_002833 [Gossypium trilobum]|uniref:Uncharacterized protein n=1 Tax=Gossypium trilobum TaxID=34281 RepID=A0A7J9F9G6_9ROSI|nr:hypothetical protein [Gossypium trilobum]